MSNCVLLNAERVVYSDAQGVQGSVAGRGFIDVRRSLGVLEFLYASPSRVLISCLVSLAIIFIADISTPRSDFFAILYIVPAATAAAVLPTKSAGGAFATALGLQITGQLLQRTSVVSILAAAASLMFVIVVLRLLSVAIWQQNDRGRTAARVAVSAAELGTLDNQLQPLTKREREVAELVADGRSAREIARQLHIGQRTVETHVARAYAKLGVRSRIELILRCAASSYR
jgi:DNA-binding NarL/FixJ family response regulator